MILENFIKNPVESYIYCEKHLNFKEATQPWAIGELKETYTATGNDKTIKLKLFKIPISETKIYKSIGTQPNFIKKFIDKEGVFFAIHPQLMEDQKYIKLLKSLSISERTITCEATASHRTFFIKDNPPYFIKTSFPKKISSSKRKIDEIDLKQGISIVNFFLNANKKNKLPENLKFQSEGFGIFVPRLKEIGGLVLRSYKSLPSNNKINIPLFSFFSEDNKNKKDPLLIEQVSRKIGITPRKYFIENIVTPQIKIWNWFIFDMGVVPSLHGQNTVLQFDDNFKNQFFVVRDFHGKKITKIAREKNLLNSQYFEKFERIEDWVTMSYDFLLGELFYDRAILCMEKRGINMAGVREEIKTIFKEEFKGKKKLEEKIVKIQGYLNKKRKLIKINKQPRYR